MKRKPSSLRTGLMASIVLCWLLPIVIVVTLGGMLLNDSYQRSAQREIEIDAENAMSQVEMFFTDAIEASKDVSYDGVVRSAYSKFLDTGDSNEMFRRINDYLAQSFSRDSRFQAVFVTFWDRTAGVEPYVLSSGTTGYELVKTYHSHRRDLKTIMEHADTGIRFVVLDGTLYVVRNLLDGHFCPYASVVLMCNHQPFFRVMNTVGKLSQVQITLDNHTFNMDKNGELTPAADSCQGKDDVRYEINVDGHTIAMTGTPEPYHIWEDAPWMYWAAALVCLMVIPALIIAVRLFRRHVTGPIEILAQAHRQLEEGKRGYQISEISPNEEFQSLYDQFNIMSKEQKNQFERSFLEQQATQQAKIKALQSQINPHFLNNTLEVINWEARLASNDRVCAMIEALSTMLDAALDRDGSSQIPLREELRYADAYLYIIRQRLGEGLKLERYIDPDMLDVKVPRLVLQPIMENAVEHDLTDGHGGRLCLRVYREDEDVVLDVEHDGTMTQTDRENIQQLLVDTGNKRIRGARVGLRNVSQRLRLLYGDRGRLTIDEVTPGNILARIRFPLS